jgi:hypothetical protein
MLRASKAQRLTYTQQMLRELREIMSSDRQAMAAYLIEMAYLEVSDQVRESRANALGEPPRERHQGEAFG